MKPQPAPTRTAIFPVFCRLAGAFAAYAGKTGVRAAFLILAGALTEGVGLILLVPLIELVFHPEMAHGHGFAVIGQAFTRLGADRAGTQLFLLTGLYCLLIFLRAGIVIARDTEMARLRTGFVTDMRQRVVDLLTHADWQVLAHLRHARLTHMLGQDVQQIGLAAYLFTQSVMNLVILIVQCVLAFYLAPVLALVTCVLMALGGLAMVPVIRQANLLGRYITGSNLSLMHHSLQFLGGLKLAMSQNLQGGFAAMFRRQLVSQADMMVAFSRQQVCNRQLISCVIGVFGAAMLLVGYLLLAIPPALLIAFLVILLRMSGPASQLLSGAQQISNVLPAFEKVAALEAELRPAAPEADPADPVADIAPADLPEIPDVVFDHVSYQHPDASHGQGVKDLCLSLAPGEFLGIEGASGAGKTTFADLLTGLYPPQKGQIRVAGQPLCGGVLAAWRQKISYVAQDPFLMAGTLRQNLSWMRTDMEDGPLWQALALAGAADLVRGLPDGLDSDMGERGSLVSGGERQRLALARALLRDPALLVLNEATNAMDRPGEQALLRRLADMKNRPTIVLISHRAESLSFCGRVLTMADGRFVAKS